MTAAAQPETALITQPSESNVNTFNISTIIRYAFTGVALVVLNLAVTLAVLDYNGLLRTPEIVSLDAANMVLGFVSAQDPDVTEDVLQARIRSLNANLDGVIASYAQDRGVIVVNSAAVLGGTRDVTGDVLAALGIVQ